MKNRHTIVLITFFSILILLSLLPVFFFALQHPAQVKQHTLPISAEKAKELQVITAAQSKGVVLCTTDDPSICQTSQEGKVLEYQVGCNGTIPSASVYICKHGRWQYIQWTPHGSCQFCRMKQK